MIFLSIYLVDFLMTKSYLGYFENHKDLPGIFVKIYLVDFTLEQTFQQMGSDKILFHE